MAMIPEDFINEIRYRCEIGDVISSYVRLKQSGKLSVGLCPFHNEKTPSFTVYHENQNFHCFGCGAGGTVITFIQKIENLSFVEAVRFLADRCGLQMPEDSQNDESTRMKTRILEANRAAAHFFHQTMLSAEGRAGYEYFRNRGLTDATLRHFGLGFAPDRWDALISALSAKGFTTAELLAADLVKRSSRSSSHFDNFRNRAMFPVIDLRGNVVAFSGRVVGGDDPRKYVNTADTYVYKKSKNLFGMNFAKSTKEDSLILVEGNMDVVSMHQAGFTNTVAPLGTAFTPDQARTLSLYTKEVKLLLDSDAAGQKAVQKAAGLLENVGVKTRVVVLEGAKDPDEFLKKFGPERLKLALSGARNNTEHRLMTLKANLDLTTDDGRVTYLRSASEVLSELHSPVERDVYIRRLAQELDISSEALTDQVNRIIRKKRSSDQKKNENLIAITSRQTEDKLNPDRRYHPRACIAEEALIAGLYRNTDLCGFITGKIQPEEFVTPFNARLFRILVEEIRAGESLDLGVLGQKLSADETGRLNHLVLAAEGQTFSRADAEELCRTIQSEKQKLSPEKAAEMKNDELLAYIEQLAKSKK
ncbi:MAG: DNA primase [Oscillospiraceae bacterium]|nr:DNA primase [Oscillospiraceae bacterium]